MTAAVLAPPPGLVLPRWGTPRRTSGEWLDRGGPAVLDRPIRWKASEDPWWPTLGHQPAKVATRLLLPPMPHHRHIFDVAYELDPEDPENLWYTEVDEWVMRQAGKTMGTLFPIIVHRLTMMPRIMGGRQRAAFTMQDRQETRRKLEIDLIPQLVEASESFRRITNPKGRPGRSTTEWKSSLNNGGEHLLFGQGNYMLIDTPTSKKAGHGGTLDLKAADEVRFGADDRIEASAGPSQITRRSRQLWVASTAGDEDSYYMWPKVVACRNRIERGDKETRVCSFEWAVPEDADLHDPETWIDFHPAVGHTQKISDILDELRKAEDSPDETKIDTFRQEYANQWIRTPILNDQQRIAVIKPEAWEARRVPTSSRIVGQRVLGVDASPGGRSASIVVAGRMSDGQVLIRVLALLPETWWVEKKLAELRDKWEPQAIAYDDGGPTKAIAPDITRAAGRVDVVKLSGSTYTSACEGFVLAFTGGSGDKADPKNARACHLDQQWLNDALDGATKKARGERWLWDRQTALADITPIVAATCALRALDELPLPPEPRRSAYEDGEFETI